MIYDDAGYDGADSSDSTSLDYYREKAREFQVVLNALDQSRSAIIGGMLALPDDESVQSEGETWLANFESKKTQMRVTAEAINLGANLVNSLGGRFPVLSIPGTLGIGPFAIPAASITALAVAGTLAVWGYAAISEAGELLRRWQSLAAQENPEQRAALAREMAKADQALAAAEGNPWGAIGSVAKWVGIAALAFVTYKVWSDNK